MSTVCPAGQALNAKVGSEEHKDAVSEHARSSLIVILVAVFIDLLGVAIVIPLLPMFVKRVGLSSGAYGWLGAFYGTSTDTDHIVSSPIPFFFNFFLLLFSSCFHFISVSDYRCLPASRFPTDGKPFRRCREAFCFAC